MRKSVLLGLASLLMVLFPAAALATFAPADRTTLQCVSRTDCPGPNYVTFNAFTDAPNPDAPNGGDERGFFEAKDAISTSVMDGFSDNLTVRDGQRLLMRVYIHNDANPDFGAAVSTARNVRVQVRLNNSATGTGAAPIAYITADNAIPTTVSDTVSLTGSTPFSLAVDQNSPVSITSRINGEGDFITRPISGTAMSGVDNFSVNLGDWPGGFKNHGSITFVAVVRMNSVQPNVVQPIKFVCSALDMNTIDNNRATFTAVSNPSAAGANVSSYTFTVKDSSGNVVDSSTVYTTASSAVYSFNQSAPGTYTVSSVVNSDKGSTTASGCSRTFTVNAQPITYATSTTASASNRYNTGKALPNTGAGDVLGLFSGASLFGAAGHYLRRRLF